MGGVNHAGHRTGGVFICAFVSLYLAVLVCIRLSRVTRAVRDVRLGNMFSIIKLPRVFTVHQVPKVSSFNQTLAKGFHKLIYMMLGCILEIDVKCQVLYHLIVIFFVYPLIILQPYIQQFQGVYPNIVIFETVFVFLRFFVCICCFKVCGCTWRYFCICMHLFQSSCLIAGVPRGQYYIWLSTSSQFSHRLCAQSLSAHQ